MSEAKRPTPSSTAVTESGVERVIARQMGVAINAEDVVQNEQGFGCWRGVDGHVKSRLEGRKGLKSCCKCRPGFDARPEVLRPSRPQCRANAPPQRARMDHR